MPQTSLVDASGRAHNVVPKPPHKLTVLIFFSGHCPMLRAHDGRVKALAATYTPRGVAFFAVASEAGHTDSNRYPFPTLRDENGKLAGQLGAQFSGYSVILDASGNVLFQGGIDSDRVELHDDATHYLRNALDDVLAGRPARESNTKSYGCVLRRG